MRRIGLLAVSLLLVATACGTGEGEDVTAPEQNGEAVPEVVESTDDELPAQFPDDVPLPDPHTVLYSMVQDRSMVVFLDSSLGHGEIRAFMGSQLPQAGWILQVCQDAEMGDEPTTVIMASKDVRLLTVMVGYVEVPQARFQGRYSFYLGIADMPEPAEVPEPATC